MTRRRGLLVVAGAFFAASLLSASLAVLALPVAVLIGLVGVAQQERDPLLSGLPGVATVVSVADAGPGDAPRVWTLLRVEIEGRAPYEVEHVVVGTAAAAPAAGDRFRVLVDPRNPRRVVHATDPAPVRARHPGRLDLQLAALGRARREDRIGDDEFAAKVDELLTRKGVG